MKKNYTSPTTKTYELNLSEKILAQSDVNNIPIDPDPGDADTQKRHDAWDLEDNYWE